MSRFPRRTTQFLSSPCSALLILLLLMCGIVLAQDPEATSTSVELPETTPAPPAGPPLLPPENKILIGATLDNDVDHPADFNNRVGRQFSAFAFSMYVPSRTDIPKGPNNVESHLDLIDATKTDAYVQLNVYPRKGLDVKNFTDTDCQKIVNICKGLNMRGRGVFLVFAPSMNANPLYGVAWGQQPTTFSSAWNRISQFLAGEEMANKTALVWAPEAGLGYPWKANVNSTRGAAIPKNVDTNGDGRLDENDDPYSPYYPQQGFEPAWVGLSVSYKGNVYPWDRNELPNKTFVSDVIQGVNTRSNVNFYNTYATAAGKNIPFMLLATGAMYLRDNKNQSVPPTGGPTELAVKQAWWRQIFDRNFRAQFPLLKMINFRDDLQNRNASMDYRITAAPDVLAAFKTDLTTLQDTLVWANASSLVTYNPADANAAPSTPSGPGNDPINTPKPPPRGDGGDGGGKGHGLYGLLFGLVLAPVTIVGAWYSYAHIKLRRRRAAEEAAALAALRAGGIPTITDDDAPSGGDGMGGGHLKGGIDADAESVDDSATIVNIMIGTLPREGDGDDYEGEESRSHHRRDSYGGMEADGYGHDGDGYEDSIRSLPLHDEESGGDFDLRRQSFHHDLRQSDRAHGSDYIR
ncbi:uncharacterized protein EV422DRAFT_17031 [Fimicolochytrium jonesii]|uniref:uncharacterized protein n=1 Tax=Fimicolochytrium jonesii TaxID=1396493 RepID=UPI0022FE0BCC|nr:uncharacterized protein EV422DRAFT_17031 [Fimicolochytrium jonesii]KAI8826912.1 hypothetical protein EV422DRAFT_17031 [Fimicolochytrium jonesii]